VLFQAVPRAHFHEQLTFQARRLDIAATASGPGKTTPVAALNGTLATRTLARRDSRNHQQADGSVRVPPALPQSYLSGLEVIGTSRVIGHFFSPARYRHSTLMRPRTASSPVQS
jgi:hypothetical protein